MPVCPGCKQTVVHDRLPVHQRYCRGLKGSDRCDAPVAQRIEARIVELDERLTEEFREHQQAIERRFEQLERELRIE